MGSDDSVLQSEKLDSFDRARLKRLLIVPISTTQIAAASSYVLPLAPTSIMTSRCFSGKLGQ